MQQFYKCLSGEFKKRKRSTFLLLHLCLPLLLTGILMLYFFSRNAPLSAAASYVIFFQIIGITTPIIVSLLCGMVADAESEAGSFQNILGLTQSKTTSLLSQITMMILSYSAALFFALSMYVVALKFVVNVREVNIPLYYLTGAIFIAAAIFQYFFYHYISYNYSIEISGIFGFVGMIINVLCLTTLGDKIWGFIPWAWANRFSNYLKDSSLLFNIEVSKDPMIITGLYSFFILTCLIICLNIVWINKWEGRKTI
ncbi:hypothetical protein LYSIN_03362 [Lysinibacillus sphaericus]|uniref:Lantibiotic immunity ABC transporter MutG family permease subunit n=1 Tax=Lysinibacillus sphaericus TaxID=1421 RepID=A0A2S5CW75_LYSSH|nr:lantibiotic immunity ABC transporter MutG family permease subunit [Lysinibacillus sphaericus]POZ55065.1 hypothetical protein LYSIN_03362 [Lysinibacillus sphaericus]